MAQVRDWSLKFLMFLHVYFHYDSSSVGQIPTDQTANISLAIQHVDGHYHALPLTDVLRIHKRKYREPGKVEYGTGIYRCPVLLGQISVAARSLLSLAAINKQRYQVLNA